MEKTTHCHPKLKSPLDTKLLELDSNRFPKILNFPLFFLNSGWRAIVVDLTLTFKSHFKIGRWQKFHLSSTLVTPLPVSRFQFLKKRTNFLMKLVSSIPKLPMNSTKLPGKLTTSSPFASHLKLKSYGEFISSSLTIDSFSPS